MAETYKPEVAWEYEELLKRVDERDLGVNENTFQDFLEHHTDLIPTPFMLNHGLHFECFISKLRIGPYVSDLAFLTKSSDVWNLVLIELENPSKKLFKGNINEPEFSAEFYHALQQVKNWKREIEDNKEQFLKQLNCIRKPLEYNDVFFKYVIVMGRNKEKSQARSRFIANECEFLKDSLRIITYDTLLSDYKRARRGLSENLVLSLDESGRARIKVLPDGEISTSLFSYVSRDCLEVSREYIERLKEQDYEMDSWLAGKLLIYNEKCTAKGMAKKMPEQSLRRAVLEKMIHDEEQI